MAIFLMWVAGIIFEVTAWTDRNPIFGAVFFWVAGGVLDHNMGESGEINAMSWNVFAMIAMHAASMFGLSGFLFFEEIQPWYEPLSFWKHGFFSNTDWSRMFIDINNLLSAILEVQENALLVRSASI